MEYALNIARRQFEAAGSDPDNLILALVPQTVAVDPIPVPRSHLSRGDRQAAALFAFHETGVRFLQFGGAGANAVFEFEIEPLQLAGLAVELGEHLDLGAQYFGHHRHRDVVDRAHLIAPQTVDIADLDGGDEDHRRLLEAGVLADHGGEFEAVEFRHADIDQDDGDVVLEQELERFAAGGDRDQVLAEILENYFIGKQLRRLIVDQKNVDLLVFHHLLS